MKAKITYMWGAWPTYSVERREDCKDEVDRSAYDAFVRSGGRAVAWFRWARYASISPHRGHPPTNSLEETKEAKKRAKRI